jgi:AcrR family transcriptional regulator
MEPPKVAKKEAPSDLKRYILDTSRRILVEQGYTSLSMRKIAAEIGYSATSIYLHFKNKDALFHALIDEGMSLLLERQMEGAARNPDDAVQRLRVLCRGYIDFGLEMPEYYEIMFLLRPKLSNRFSIEIFRRARRNLDLVRATIETGVTEGMMDVGDVDSMTHVIWAQLHGAISILLAMRLDIRVDRQEFIENVIDQVVLSVTKSRLQPAN